jgi:alpha-glucosidase
MRIYKTILASSIVRSFVFATLAILAIGRGAAAQSKPVDDSNARTTAPADPRAVVIDGRARFSVLTPQLIRMEWAADGKFEDHASFVFIHRRLPVPKFSVNREGSRLTIDTGALRLTYDADGANNGELSPTDLGIAFVLNGKERAWHPGAPDTGNLLGTTRTLDGALGGKTKEPIGDGLISRDGWALVDDSTRPLFDSDDFSFAQGEKSAWPWVMPRPAGSRQDWYFFGYGHDYKKALGDYVRVAGRIPLPPRFAFGAWWSRYWAYSDQELDDLVRDFHENDVPLDVLVIDMDWHLSGTQLTAAHDVDQSGQRLGWSGYTWNPLLFPDPKAFLAHVHQEGLKVTLNLHPASGVQRWEAAYPAMARAMGIDPTTKKYVPFDITNKKFATNYMDILHHPLEREGINFWWLDWQQQPNTKLPGVNNTWWLNYVHFTDQEREGKRPLLFHRWGGLGNHRYQIGFSGDTISMWPSLAYQPWFTATAANVGYAYWSHDIGGHMPGAVDPELYTRWIQFGVFSPILRTHSAKNPNAERRIWAYPEPYSDIMRNAFHLRYALQPYIYTEARRTYDTGVAFVRPLYYDWPNSDQSYTSRGEYMFGGSMIVAPVTKAADPETQLATEDIWLPKGEWIEWFTGRHFTGPIAMTRSFSIGQIPVYVRAGSIVPMMPKMEYTGEKPVDPLILNVFPLADGQRSTYTLYEDSGKAEEYKKGVCAWTGIEASRRANMVEIVIRPPRGKFDGMLRRRGFEIRLPGDWPPFSVEIDGRSVGFEEQEGKQGWRYEGNTLTTIITVSRRSVSETVTVDVHRSPSLLAKSSQLSGFAGEMTRYFKASDTINHAGLGSVAPNSLIELFQTGDRLMYAPALASEEMARLPTMYRVAVSDVQKLLAPVEGEAKLDALSSNDRKVPDIHDQQRRILYLHRAIAMLKDAQPAEEH